MSSQEDKTSRDEKAKYVWDPVKLAWVQSAEATTSPAEVEPAEEEVLEPRPAEDISEDEVLTGVLPVEGEAIGEELEYKGVLIRMAAAVLDFIVLSILSLIIRYTVGQVVDIPTWALPLYGLIYFVAFWSWRGQTPGKMVLGAKIVRTSGMKMGIDRAFVRYLFYLFPLYAPLTYLGSGLTVWFIYLLPIVGVVIMALVRNKRGLHDLIAGTCVVNTRRTITQPQEFETAEPEEPGQSGTSTARED